MTDQQAAHHAATIRELRLRTERAEEMIAWVATHLSRTTRDGSLRMRGISSDAMVSYALGGALPSSLAHLGEYPGDPGDLAACERCRESAPAHLHPAMDRVLAAYREAVGKVGR